MIKRAPVSSSWKTKLGIAALLFSLLTLACLTQYIAVARLPFTPLKIPLSLKGADHYEADFKIGVKGEYAVELYDYRSYEGSEAEVERLRTEATALLSQSEVTWQIIRQGKVVTCSPHETAKITSRSYGRLGRNLCHFDGELGEYHITFRFIKKPDIAPFNEPKLILQVGLGAMDYLDYAVKMQLAFCGVIVFGSIGLILFFFLRRRSKKSSADADD